VETEHLLLALTHQPGARRLLAALGVDFGELRGVVEAEIARGSGSERVCAREGSGMPYSARAKHVLEFAIQEARDLNHARVGTEHLLLGLIRTERGGAALALQAVGVTLHQARGIVARDAVLDRPPHFRVVIDDTSDRSIYEQIIAQVQEAVATARLRSGDRLPPVRQLADELDVAPGTVARAYAELERLTVIVTEGARGTRIAPRPNLVPAADRPAALVGLLRPVAVAAFYLDGMKRLASTVTWWHHGPT
jgi:DNA-binding transcriptional regulator YhcF (GntR family)